VSAAINRRPVCLTIGGSDSSAGAGIQADLEVFTSLALKGCCAITALTAQNPSDINRIEVSPLEQVEAEIRAVYDCYSISAVKTGMLVDRERIRLVASLLKELHPHKPLVVDPVMVATSGIRLLNKEAVQALTQELFPLATLITPNIPESEELLGRAVSNPVEDAAELCRQTKTAVLLKGGHGQGDALVDVLCEPSGEITAFHHRKQNWDDEQAHGSGCRLASALAAFLALDLPLADAVSRGITSLLQGNSEANLVTHRVMRNRRP